MTTDLDQLLRDANPAPQNAVDHLDLGDAPDLLRRAMVDEEPATTPNGRTAARQRRWRRRGPLLVAMAFSFAVLGVFAVASVDRLDRVSPSPGQAWAAEAVRAAKEVPRVLPSEPGWTISYADEAFDGEFGSVQFANGNRAVELTWYPRKEYGRYFKDRDRGSETDRFEDGSVTGEKAVFFRYADSDDYFAMWKTGKHFIEARVQPDIPPEWKNKPMPAGEGMGGPPLTSHFDEASFRRFITSLRAASVDAWLSGMPSSVIKPGESAEAIDRMLADVPTPKGFDRSRLVDESATRDRYQLGAAVTGSVACGWLRQWVRAIRAGDTDQREEAIEAMASARTWSILKTMTADGAYPQVIWEYADQMRRDTPASPAGGGAVTFEQEFESGLGCLGSNAPPR